MCLTNRDGKGEGACCCCLYSVQPLRGFLHQGERSFSTTSEFPLQGGVVGAGGLQAPRPCQWPGQVSIHSHSAALPSAQTLNSFGTDTILSRGGSPLQQEAHRSYNSTEPSQTLPHPPLPQCLCSTLHRAGCCCGTVLRYPWGVDRSNGEKFYLVGNGSAYSRAGVELGTQASFSFRVLGTAHAPETRERERHRSSILVSNSAKSKLTRAQERTLRAAQGSRGNTAPWLAKGFAFKEKSGVFPAQATCEVAAHLG